MIRYTGSMFVRNALGQAQFNFGKMGKTALCQGDFLFAGLNALWS